MISPLPTNQTDSGSFDIGESTIISIPVIEPLLPPPVGEPLPEITKKKREPAVKLVGCPVDVIKQHELVVGSVFKTFDDDEVPLNTKDLESKYPDKPKEVKPVAVEKTDEPEKAVSFLKFLSADRSRNIEIILRNLRKSAEDLAASLKGQNYKLSQLESMRNMLISHEEELRARDCVLDRYSCSENEWFVCRLVQVPCFRERIDSLLLLEDYEKKIEYLRAKQQRLAEAFDAFRACPELRYVLKVALALSNYLNGQQFKGGAWGFRLGSLHRFSEVRSEAGKSTLADELIRYVREKYAFPIFERQWIEGMDIVADSSVEQCSELLKEIKLGLRKLQEAAQSKNPLDASDIIDKKCSDAIATIEGELSQLGKNDRRLQASFESCAKFYCETSLKSNEVGNVLLNCCRFVREADTQYQAEMEKARALEATLALKKETSYKGESVEAEHESAEEKKKQENPEEAEVEKQATETSANSPISSVPTRDFLPQSELKSTRSSMLSSYLTQMTRR